MWVPFFAANLTLTLTLASQTQYVGALLRSAAQMYSSSTTLTLDAKLTRLCIEHIQPHVYDELQLIKDEFSQVPLPYGP